MKLVSEKILLACEVIGLLIAKINILKQQQITCYEWQPLKQLLKVKSLQHIEIWLLQLKKKELVNQFKPMFPFSSPRKLQKTSKFFKGFRGLIKGTLAQHG